MPQVFDASTGKPVDLPPDQAQAGLVAGKLVLNAQAGPVLLGGQNGKVFTAPPEKVASALATGAYRLLSDDEALKHQVHTEEQAKGLAGSLEAGGESALNQLLLGVPEAIDQEKLSPEEQHRQELVNQEHGTARFLGGALGVGGSLAFGGELFKGAELAGQAVEHGIVPATELADASLATRLAGKAANYATQGALVSAPQAGVHIAYGDPQKTAETLLWGIGAGALLGGGAELASSAVKGVGEGIQSVLANPTVREKADEVALRTGLKLVGADKAGQYDEDFLKELGNFVHDEGIIKPGASRADIGDAISNLHKKYGKDIGDTIDRLDEVMKKGTADTDLTQNAIKPGQLGDAIRDALDSPDLHMPMNAEQRRALDDVVKSANMIKTTKINGQEVVPFGDAQKFVNQLRGKWLDAGGEMPSAAYQVARDAVQNAAERVGGAANEPELVGMLQKANAAYGKTSQLEKLAANLEATRANKREMGLTDFIHMGNGVAAGVTSGIGAAVGSVFGPAGTFIGHQIGRTVGIPLDLMARHWMEDKGLVMLSSLARRVAKEGPQVWSSVVASEAGKRLEATAATAQDVLRKMMVSGIQATAARTQEHMKHLLGTTVGLSGDQQYDKLGARLTQLATNPYALAQASQNMASPFGTLDPQLQTAYADKLSQAVQYLYANYPKPPGPPLPFSPQDWEPSALDKLGFHDRAEIVANPMRALEHMSNGTLSAEHVDALKTIYPQIYTALQQTILEFAGKHPDAYLDMPSRQSVGRFLGMPIGFTGDEVRQLQAGYAPKPPANDDGSKPVKGAKLKNLPSQATTFSSTQGPPEAA